MIDFSRIQHYYLACGYTDMRKQIDGLVALVRDKFGKEPDEVSLFLFCGRKSDRMKALYWDGTGYILLYKRLAEKRFQWPRNQEELMQLTQQEFRWLLEGLKVTQKTAFVPGRHPCCRKKIAKIEKSKRILPTSRRINIVFEGRCFAWLRT